jgi:hypothetical protein
MYAEFWWGNLPRNNNLDKEKERGTGKGKSKVIPVLN